MGSYWLHDLPDVLAGMTNVRYWPGWETRSRSSGGFDHPPMGVVMHHNACPPTQSTDAYCRQAWGTHPERPVGNLYLARDGEVIVGCAGASNCAGKGGPWKTSKGTIPLDKANQNTINIEVGNNGVNEWWTATLLDRYVELVARLDRGYGLNPLTDNASHHEWAITDGRGTILGSRGRPSRKIDPAGPQDRYPYINSSKSWDYDLFRADIAAWDDGGAITPTPPKGKKMYRLVRYQNDNAVWLSDHITMKWIDENADGNTKAWLKESGFSDEVLEIPTTDAALYGPVVGPMPDDRKRDAWGVLIA